MLIYGGEVSGTPSELSRSASVALMAPRVKRERMGTGGVHIFGHRGGRKLRNLGCGLRSRFGHGLQWKVILQLIQVEIVF